MRNDRLHNVEDPGDVRSPAQRDRDRILYSSAFRRLAGVTQVVGASEGFIFHNRLTHSLKVGQLGRRIAEKVALEQAELLEVTPVDPDVVETAGLAHDLGHPPFGHVAETVLKQAAPATAGDYDAFEGNPQSFRIVTKLAMRTFDFEREEGLDLTRAALNRLMCSRTADAQRDVHR